MDVGSPGEVAAQNSSDGNLRGLEYGSMECNLVVRHHLSNGEQIITVGNDVWNILLCTERESGSTIFAYVEKRNAAK